MAEIRPPDRRELGDRGQFDRSVPILELRDHLLCFHHKQEVALPTNHRRCPGPDHGALLRPS